MKLRMLTLAIAAVVPFASICRAQLLSDNFAADSSLKTSLWTEQSSILNAVAFSGSSYLTPTLSFGPDGMQMTGINGDFQCAGIQSLAAFAAPFTLSTTVKGTLSYGNAFVVYLVNSNLTQWLSIHGDLTPDTCYQNIWINYTGSGSALSEKGSTLYGNPSTNVWYTIQMSVGTDGDASVALMTNGVTLTSQSGLPVGNGPFYVVLAQKEGEPCTSGPLAATWQYATVVNGNPAASAARSRLTATPTSLPADGTSATTATVTLLDVNGNLVSGKTVTFYAAEVNNSGSPVAGSLSISQPVSLTDTNGHATATITANTPGTAIISAKDTTDNVLVHETATVTFTQPTVALGPILGGAVAQLMNATTQLIQPGGDIFNDVTGEAFDGDYFQQESNDTEAKAVLDAGFFDGSAILPDMSFLDSLLTSIAGNAAQQYIENGIPGIRSFLGQYIPQNGGLGIEAMAISQQALADLQAIQQQEEGLENGVPQASVNMATAYASDLQLRLNGDQYLMNVITYQDYYLSYLYEAAQSQSDNQWFSWIASTAVDAGAVVAAQFIPGVDAGVDVGLILGTELRNYENYSNYRQLVATAQHSVLSCLAYTGQIYSNVASAYSEIAQSIPPNPVTGEILV
jgi:hypothetical protein